MIKLYFPVKFVGITQGYSNNHKAIDLGWSTSYGGPNHEIISPADGVITYVKKDYNRTDKNTLSYGNYVKIEHEQGVVTLLAHMKYNSIVVSVGDKVKKGQKIGIMGNTGYSKGTHVHYEVIINKEKYNPLLYTYYTNDFVVGTNTKSNYNILFEEDKVMENNTTINDIIFEYTAHKTGMYKIHLNENEKLIIKD